MAFAELYYRLKGEKGKQKLVNFKPLMGQFHEGFEYRIR